MSVDLALKLHRLPRPKVLVVGDLILDCDIHGSTSRYAAEAPGCPVFAAGREERRSGGAGAVRAMAEGLGAEAVLVRGPRVSRKFRYFVEGKQVFRADGDAAGPLTPGEEACVVRDVEAALATADAVLIADYGKGLCTDAVLRAAIGGAAARLIPCVVDPHRNPDWMRYAGASAIKCNVEERRLCKCCWGLYVSRLVVTFGADGMSLVDMGSPTAYPARRRDAADTVGAGDMVLAALGVCVAEGGLSWPDACRVANAAAGLKCERRGAVPVERVEVIADLCRETKIIPAELLPAVAGAARSRGKRVAFANGCFDVIHRGHLHCLESAKGRADVLIVGVNDDAGVRALKGDGRPVNGLADRTATLAGLACVDWVVSFAGPTPAGLVKAVKPDLLVKGAEYAGREVAGAEHAAEVWLCPMLPGRSTTATLRLAGA